MLYEDHVKESVEATTVLMDQSNHILKDGYHEDAAPISRNFFEEERNTVMAGDLRQDNRDRLSKVGLNHMTPQPTVAETEAVYLG